MRAKNRRGDWHYPLSKDCLRGVILRTSGGVERMQLQSVAANANTKAEEDSLPAAQPCESIQLCLAVCLPTILHLQNRLALPVGDGEPEGRAHWQSVVRVLCIIAKCASQQNVYQR